MENRNSLNAIVMCCKYTTMNKDGTVSFNGCFDALTISKGSETFDIIIKGNIDMLASGLQVYKKYYINVSIFDPDGDSGTEINTIVLMINPEDLKNNRWYEFTTVIKDVSIRFDKGPGDYTVSVFLAPDSNFDKGEIIALKNLRVRKLRHY